jgi:hypothetical protein
MLQKSFLFVILCTALVQGHFRRFAYAKREQNIVRSIDDPGEPLFLTPYLEQGKIEEARQLR